MYWSLMEYEYGRKFRPKGTVAAEVSIQWSHDLCAQSGKTQYQCQAGEITSENMPLVSALVKTERTITQ